MINNKLILKWHVIGFFVISIIGTLLHFTYDFFENAYFVGLFSPINESVFEHLKMVIFGTLFFMIVEHIYLYKNDRYFLAKYISIMVGVLSIVVIFYTYTFYTKESILIIDIITFYVSIFLEQFVSYKVMTKDDFKMFNNFGELHAKYLLVILVLFTFFMTFYPFKIDIFEDKTNNTYGIFEEKL